MQLTLLVPGLCWGQDDGPEALLGGVALPALARIWRFGRHEAEAFSLSQLYHRFLPLQNWASHYAQIDAEYDHYWLSPVHLRVNRDYITLADGAVHGINSDEAAQLCAGLNAFLSEEGWQLSPVHPDLWHVRVPKGLDLTLVDLADVVGQDVDTHQPQGADVMHIQRIQTEIQMWLYQHPLNAEREAKGHLSINGVWLWSMPQQGGAAAADVAYFVPPQQQWQMALAVHDAPYDFAAWQAQRQEEGVMEMKACVLLEDALGAMQYDDAWGYQQSLIDLEARFFAPALAALKAGQLSQLRLVAHGPHGGQVSIGSKAHWAFWRQQQSFTGRVL
ncbi:MAG: hypothetical protein KBC57_08255 [Neisseriaceae bacterium]|nr:hypothetical protein [Neisseriaceae bacterium]